MLLQGQCLPERYCAKCSSPHQSPAGAWVLWPGGNISYCPGAQRCSEASMCHLIQCMYFHKVVLAHTVPEQHPLPKALIVLIAPAWIWSSFPQSPNCCVACWSWSGLDSRCSPPSVPHPRPMFTSQFCFLAGFSVTAIMSPYSSGTGSPGISRRSCEAGGGLGRPSGAAETAGCCY